MMDLRSDKSWFTVLGAPQEPLIALGAITTAPLAAAWQGRLRVTI
ncbi:hypothetical protein C1Y40_04497 [Mycobacterium talmoniae]|uniref:Uncharacterized protein n=1 Tax=Mycobacterium talmoniae TaxID=1858794 RepID=A0A2S8BFB2_9MYCO|nr:hypothetical protein C1Y40_04497 [Mycobacterium talmoniae]